MDTYVVSSLDMYEPEYWTDMEILDPDSDVATAVDTALTMNQETPEFYPQILWEFIHTRLNLGKGKRNSITVRLMDAISKHLSNAGNEYDMKQAWIYFWQILCYSFYDNLPPKGFKVHTWYNHMKWSIDDVDLILYKLVLKSYEFQHRIDIQFVIETWIELNRKMEPDSDIYQIIFGIIHKNSELGLHNNLLDSIIYDIIYKSQPIMDKNLVNKIFKSQYIYRLTLNQLYGLYIGCDISEDTTCTNTLDSIVIIPNDVKHTSTKLQEMDGLAYQEQPLYIHPVIQSNYFTKWKVTNNFPDHDYKHLSRLLKDKNHDPLIIGVRLTYHSQQINTFTDFKPIIEHYINRLTSNPHCKDNEYKDRILQAWKFFFNPDILKLLDPGHAFKILQTMRKIIHPRPPSIMIYNCVLSRILDDDIKDIDFNLLEQIYKYGVINLEFNEVTFGLWFKYFISINFGQQSSTDNIALQWVDQVMILFFQKTLNITPKIYRQVVIIWIKYDLHFDIISRLNILRF